MPEWVFTEEQYNQFAKEWLEQGGKWHGRCLVCKYAIVLLKRQMVLPLSRRDEKKDTPSISSGEIH